jgi:hypothetical protein
MGEEVKMEEIGTWCEPHKMYDVGHMYKHARMGKRGITLYEGSWAERSYGGCGAGYFTVIRGKDGKPLRFATPADLQKYLEGHSA